MQITHDQANQQFDACDGSDCGYVRYKMEDSATINIVSTYVPPELRGGGKAAEITRFVLDYARAEGLQVIATCSYTQLFFRRHKDYADLLKETV